MIRKKDLEKRLSRLESVVAILVGDVIKEKIEELTNEKGNKKTCTKNRCK